MARDDEGEAEETVVVDREAAAETITVDRAGDGDRTLIVDRGSADGTVAVTRDRATPTSGEVSLPRGRRRRGMTMPPVAPGFGRGAVDAVGPNAVTAYPPRAVPDLPPEPVAVEGWNAATRAPAPAMPSVGRRSRRFGAAALAAFAVSCLVSVAGLVALGVAVWGGWWDSVSVTQPSLDPDALIARVEREAEEAQQRAVVAQRFAADVAAMRSEARSPRGEVTLAVDTSGRLTSLDLTEAALELSPSELSALILATAASAQKRAAREAIALSEEVFGADAGVVGQLRGEFEARVGDLSDDEDEADGGPATGVRW